MIQGVMPPPPAPLIQPKPEIKLIKIADIKLLIDYERNQQASKALQLALIVMDFFIPYR